MLVALGSSPDVLNPDLWVSALNAYPGIVLHDFLRYWLIAGGVFALVNVALAKPLSGRKIREGALPKGQIQREILASMRTTIIFSLTGLVVAAGAVFGVISLQSVAEQGWIYFAFSLAVLIVAHDAWFYWTHRLLHDPRLFRRFHRLHHKSHAPTPFTSYAFNTGEAVLNAVYLPLILLVLPASFPALILFGVHMMVRNAVGHCGFELFPARWNGRPTFDWLTTVTHHDLHHADARWNFGLYFSWWDRLMGTEHPAYHEKFATATRRWLEPKTTEADPVTRGAVMLVAALISVAALTSASASTANDIGTTTPAITDNWMTEGFGGD